MLPFSVSLLLCPSRIDVSSVSSCFWVLCGPLPFLILLCCRHMVATLLSYPSHLRVGRRYSVLSSTFVRPRLGPVYFNAWTSTSNLAFPASHDHRLFVVLVLISRHSRHLCVPLRPIYLVLQRHHDDRKHHVYHLLRLAPIRHFCPLPCLLEPTGPSVDGEFITHSFVSLQYRTLLHLECVTAVLSICARAVEFVPGAPWVVCE